MKVIKAAELQKLQNPNPRERFKADQLSPNENARLLGGHFSMLYAGGVLPCHYHVTRESLIVLISGEIVEIVDGKEHLLKAGDAIFIGAGEKHQMENRSTQEARYLEFYTPLAMDVVQVK